MQKTVPWRLDARTLFCSAHRALGNVLPVHTFNNLMQVVCTQDHLHSVMLQPLVFTLELWNIPENCKHGTNFYILDEMVFCSKCPIFKSTRNLEYWNVNMCHSLVINRNDFASPCRVYACTLYNRLIAQDCVSCSLENALYPPDQTGI